MLDQLRNVLLNDDPDPFHDHLAVLMGQPVAQADDAAPRDFGMSVPQIVRHAPGRFTELS